MGVPYRNYAIGFTVLILIIIIILTHTGVIFDQHVTTSLAVSYSLLAIVIIGVVGGLIRYRKTSLR